MGFRKPLHCRAVDLAGQLQETVFRPSTARYAGFPSVNDTHSRKLDAYTLSAPSDGEAGEVQSRKALQVIGK